MKIPVFSPLKRHQGDVDFYTEISCVNQQLGEPNQGTPSIEKAQFASEAERNWAKDWAAGGCYPRGHLPLLCLAVFKQASQTWEDSILLLRKGCVVCGGARAVAWLLLSVQVTWCLHPLPKSPGIWSQGQTNPEDGRSAQTPGSRAGRREYPYNGGFRTEGWENLIWELL